MCCKALKLRVTLQNGPLSWVNSISPSNSERPLKDKHWQTFFAESSQEDISNLAPKLLLWKLYVDGSSGKAGSGARIVLISPMENKLNFTLCFGFKATNNVAYYEALLAGLRLAKEMSAKEIEIHSYSQLVISQVIGKFITKDKNMADYLMKAKDQLLSFEKYELSQIPRTENFFADVLSKLASSQDTELFKTVLVELLLSPSTSEKADETLWVE
ncbi:Polynucleotidyl transferase [Abeliophyllum distichum]|uniref:Polynucleotidyl transferase n=1 Tax=Abeliophyllum distichum TaxID=126358 RepID=A0ABD1QYD3_9LAMI